MVPATSMLTTLLWIFPILAVSWRATPRRRLCMLFIDAHNTAATGIYGNNNSGFADDKRSMKITLDCWDDDYEVGGVKGNLNYTKYDLKKDDNTTVKLTDKLQSLYVQSDGENYTGDNIHKGYLCLDKQCRAAEFRAACG